ncbi:hypothetical protein VP1G_06362 [Cytospora mali]|uniref:Uncharacterized protein n=1 Tax=Cytospora mali TaxID=578113 RepID=A0A194V5A6_CYTMA|nr:hypothetical protein VP1G_06362 [Valsa mali var. pyri (nom. inval.)]
MSLYASPGHFAAVSHTLNQRPPVNMPIPNFTPRSETDESQTQQPEQQQQLSEEDQGRPTGAGVNTGAGSTREKTAEELEADRLYEEAMEDEYAKRDGGS